MPDSTIRQFGEDVASVVDDQREAAADFVDRVGDRVVPIGDRTANDFAHRAQDILHSAADYMRRADVQHVVDDVRRFAKSNPVPMVLGALALGFVAGRALRRG